MLWESLCICVFTQENNLTLAEVSESDVKPFDVITRNQRLPVKNILG
jgi:hypothetical protein